MIIRLIAQLSRCRPAIQVASLSLAVLVSLSMASCNRQALRRSAPDRESESVTKISLRDKPEQAEMEELVLPQLEQEKNQDYSFNRAANVFDVNLDNADLNETLQSMCDILDYNLILGPQISDSLSLTLHDVTFHKFLEIALNNRGYDYRLEENFLYVDLPGLETRIFNLDYLNASRQLQGQMNITGQAGQAGGSLIPQSNTQLQTQNIVNLWSDIRNTLVEIVLSQGVQLAAQITAEGSYAGNDIVSGHRLVIEPNSGVIQITASRDVLEKAAAFLDAIESSLQRQVMIEARFVEINLNKSFGAGLDWSVIPDLGGISNLGGGLAGGVLASQSLSPSAREFQMGVSNDNINAILTAISRHGKINILQSPQVSTLNNQPAVIRVARNETFFQRQETPGQPATATSAATQPVVNYLPITQPTGVVLNLTPQIGENGTIIMAIRPSITSIASVATSPDGLSTSPVTDIRELDTVAKVRHGQTIILAGLIQERVTENVKETPGLSRLPLLGKLFRQVSEERQKVELIILLTPFINYSRTNDELAADKNQIPHYKEVAKNYQVADGEFRSN
ncbi:type II secretion system protein GspD [Gemmatimonadota bacterium]